jgi:hypothetical protein
MNIKRLQFNKYFIYSVALTFVRMFVTLFTFEEIDCWVTDFWRLIQNYAPDWIIKLETIYKNKLITKSWSHVTKMMKQFDHMIERKLNLEFISNVFPRLSNVFPRLKFLAGCGQFSDMSNIGTVRIAIQMSLWI